MIRTILYLLAFLGLGVLTGWIMKVMFPEEEVKERFQHYYEDAKHSAQEATQERRAELETKLLEIQRKNRSDSSSLN